MPPVAIGVTVFVLALTSVPGLTLGLVAIVGVGRIVRGMTTFVNHSTTGGQPAGRQGITRHAGPRI